MSEEKKDYGKTLNLPKTDFPMRASLPENEPKIQQKIFDNGLYEKSLKKNEKNPTFILHDGPPYANGEIHIGHALNKTLKDVINRYKMLRGFKTIYVPGYDTHGLPTEKRAIQVLGLNRDEIGINKFRDTCRDFSLQFVDKQTEGFKRLGVLGDWEHPYITLQPEFEARQIDVFGTMYEKGYIYKGLKPVYWCTDCETALAEAEIEYLDVKTNSIYVKFPVLDAKGKFDEKNTYLIIWTTTTWTLPGNTGIVVGGDFEYSIVEVNDERYIIATELVERLMNSIGNKDYKIVKTLKGSELENITYKHPFMDRTSRVILGSEDTVLVDLSTGTGLVHCAPGYGKEDHMAGVKNGLETIVAVDGKGYQTEEAGQFAGLYYEKANEKIAQWLKENNYLLYTEEVEHSYPHCWRCKNPIIFRATKQWFCSVDKFKDQAVSEAEKVDWVPKWGKDRMTNMIKERADWCISRQRTWGVPLPIYYCQECGKEYITRDSIEKLKTIFREKGSNAWWDLPAEELMPENSKCSNCGCTKFEKEKDIMDVWFDSGSTHQSVLVDRGLPYPADLYLEGADQYRGWFQSSLLTSVAINGIAPYKQVLTHGWTVDGQGRKMSKSLGNGISPQEVIKEYGVDILRLWVTSSDYQSDVSLSKDILKQITEVYRKIRNTARYILGNLADFDPEKQVEYKDLEELDKWALLRLNKLIRAYTKNFENYEFHNAYHSMNQFCVTDMSNFYLDIIKDRLYTSKPDSKQRRAAQTAMYKILDALVRMLAPMVCFTAEEIWEYMPHKKDDDKESVMLNAWPQPQEEYDNKELSEKWDKILELKELVAKRLEVARADKLIGHSLNAKVTLFADDKEYEFLKENVELLQQVFIVSGLQVGKNERKYEDKIGIKIELAEGDKCERCWMYSTTVGEDKENPTICKRCSEAIN